VALAAAALGLVYTWPLAAHWDRAIAYVYQPSPGWEVVPEMPGDHLQFYYWSWLFADNALGPSEFPSNPYEFNTFLHPEGIDLYANFPFSLVYLLFLPLGPQAAYNCMLWASYLLAGLAAFLLARRLTGSGWAALPLAFMYALLPFRASQALSGHLYGFIAFLLPLGLWCLEEGWRKGSWRWGVGAGLCWLAVGCMEQHLFYYGTLALGLYVVLRVATMPAEPDQGRGETRPGGAGGAWAAAAGLALALTLHLAAARGAGQPAAGPDWVLAAVAGALAGLGGWLAASWLAAGFTRLDQAEAGRLLGRGLAPLVLSLLYSVQPWLEIPHLGKLLLLVLVVWGAARCLPGLWRARRRPELPRRAWPPLAGLGLGWAGGMAAMLYQKMRVLDQSIASEGRSLDDVRLFAPGPADLLAPSPAHSEQNVYLGLALLITAGLALILLAARRPAGRGGAGAAPLWTGLGLLAALLCLGPNLPELPLYGWLYDHLPFFNYPRVPGRLVLVAVLFLGLAGAWALAALGRALGRRGVAAAGLAAAALVAVDFWPPTPGICLLPPPGPSAEAIGRGLPTGPRADQRLLGLPIWPGDSHQSSVFELLITRTRAKMVNGYSPQTPRAYVEEVFWPLYPLDFGQATDQAWELLQRLRVGMIAFCEDEEVYTRKVSPFPPELARRRLVASGRFRTSLVDGNLVLLEPVAGAGKAKAVSQVVSPVVSVWEAAWLPRRTGRLVEDPGAGGWGLLFEEPSEPGAPLGPRLPRPAGNVAQALAGRDAPGWLSLGPGQRYPPGRYVLRFRLRRGPGASPAGRVEATDNRGRLLAAAELTPKVLPADGAWHDVALPVELAGITPLQARTYFYGGADLELDRVLVGFAGATTAEGFYPACRLWRQTGSLAVDPRAPDGLAVAGRADLHPPLYLMHGPQATLPPGEYRAVFLLAAPGHAEPGAVLAHLAAATDLGRITLGHAEVEAGRLGPEYREVAVPFKLQRRAEVGLRVRYGQGGDLLVAGAAIVARP
jgi:hypothetical protein